MPLFLLLESTGAQADNAAKETIEIDNESLKLDLLLQAKKPPPKKKIRHPEVCHLYSSSTTNHMYFNYLMLSLLNELK